MKTTSTFERALTALDAAGFAFTVIYDGPPAGCPTCGLALAA